MSAWKIFKSLYHSSESPDDGGHAKDLIIFMLESKCMNWILIIYFSKHLMLCFEAALDVIEI
jgi:hypothetical protein